MAYSSLDDLKRRLSEPELIQLTEDATPGQVDLALVAALQAEADDLIDLYLKGRANLPLNPVPKAICGAAADLTLYLLFQRRSAPIPNGVAQARQNALDLLTKLQAGQLSVQAEAELARHPSFLVESQEAWFGKNTLDQY